MIKLLHGGRLTLMEEVEPGSTGVAAVRSGRSFIGMEMSDQYFEIASSRIREENERALEDF